MGMVGHRSGWVIEEESVVRIAEQTTDMQQSTT